MVEGIADIIASGVEFISVGVEIGCTLSPHCGDA
jgi:hypothetical protein